MPIKSTNEVYANAVFNAQRDVSRAMTAHSQGGSIDAVNRANRALAEAHCRYQEASGGDVPDDRY